MTRAAAFAALALGHVAFAGFCIWRATTPDDAPVSFHLLSAGLAAFCFMTACALLIAVLQPRAPS